MSSQPQITPSVTPAPAAVFGGMRPDLTTQRCTRRLVITPKYGSAPCELEVSYLWCGAPDAPTVIVQGGISATRDVVALDGEAAPGWWQAQVGPGLPLDLDRYRVLSIDWIAPADLAEVQAVSSEDQADVLAALVDALGINRVHAFIGSSYGAMVALAFAARHPYALGRLVLLAGAHRPHPLATAQRSVQRGIVRLGLESGQADQALALARQLAMTTYRGSEEFAKRFTAAPEFRDGRFHFPVEDYLEHAGRRFVERFDVERFLALSESIDLHDVTPEQVAAPARLIGFPSDRLVPLADLCELQRRLHGPATLEVVESPYGHDAFLKETDRLAPLLRDALAGC
ncbi:MULTISPECIES: homoserine O-succinyltransferase [unclassified Dyella]|uniref:homoserine O-succinyltransferase MetX n=1 Tax=unclassified Dyella TaxID=2634549 RepID=UPI000C83C405|nr:MULTISPECIES: homoserine O-succinyltransferase [unclassified Dyella]MDR3444343.1 homoserine O-succinyltransferase [Dyella sp.]PMQ06075.1 L-serine/homoserine O-acetyltransferase [Dyella sp. AD56]